MSTIWTNINGYHWQIERRDFILMSAKSLQTLVAAERDLKKVCAKLGIKLGRITYEN